MNSGLSRRRAVFSAVGRPGMHVWCDGAGLLFVICLLGFELLHQCFVLAGRLGDSESSPWSVTGVQKAPLFSL